MKNPQLLQKSILVLILGFLLPKMGLSQSNEGTDFWLGFMEHRDVNANTKVLMITSAFNTSGRVEMPLQSFSQDFTVNANTVKLINLPISAETIGSEIIDNTGIHVTSDLPISLYAHQYANLRSEAAMILPVPSLGKEYYVMSYYGFQTDFPSEFLIVAVEDDTEVFIDLAERTAGGRNAGTSYSVTLDQGESYQVQAYTGDGADMTGTHLRSEQNFVVFGGARWSEVPSGCQARDNLYELMYPVATWGERFVSVKSENASYDLLRIMAAEDNTQVFINNSLAGTLDKGEFLSRNNSADAVWIEGTKPILVAQFNIGNQCSNIGNSQGDPSMVLLNSVDQTRENITLYSSQFENISTNYVNIITQASNSASVQIDGTAVSGLGTGFQSVPNNSDYVYARVAVSSGTHNIISGGCGVIVTAYGYGDVESYAYSGGASFKPINLNPIPEGGCLNDTIFFTTGLPSDRTAALWDFGDGTGSSDLEPMHIYTDLGTYEVELIVFDLCTNSTDTIRQSLLVSLRQDLNAEGDLFVCQGGSIQLGASDLAGARYEWKGPGGYFSEEQFPVLSDLLPSQSGIYSVVGIISGCATFPQDQAVTVNPTPTPEIGNDSTICDAEPIYRESNPYVEYLWQDGSRNQGMTITQPGTYWVTASDELGCIGTDSLTIIEKCPPRVFIPSAFTPNDDGFNDFFSYIATDVENFQLSIYNRWGQEVFSTANSNQHWDGLLSGGSPAYEGVYVWKLSYDELGFDGYTYQRRMAGTVTLIR